MANEMNPKRKPAIEATIGGAGNSSDTLVLAFSNGNTLTISPAMLSDSIREQAMMHGLKQKLADAAAISCSPETGKSATVDDKYNAVLDVYNRLLAGSWNKGKGESSGGGAGGLLFRALCELYDDKTPEQIRTFLTKKDAKAQAALRDVPKIAAIIARLRSAKVASIDGDSLLAGLEDDDNSDEG